MREGGDRSLLGGDESEGVEGDRRSERKERSFLHRKVGGQRSFRSLRYLKESNGFGTGGGGVFLWEMLRGVERGSLKRGGAGTTGEKV